MIKRISLFALVFFLGGIVGFLSYSYFASPDPQQKIAANQSKKVVVTQIQKEVVHDTVIKERVIHVQQLDSLHNSTGKNTQDTLYVIQDSTKTIDSVITDEAIIQETMINQITISLISLDKDTNDIEALLGLEKKTFSPEIIVEFWHSPLQLIGYVLTRNKLKLFGFNPNESITLYLINNDEDLRLVTSSVDVVLSKTNQFKTITIRQ